RLAEAG
ncbi:hypothetical protein MKD33_10695, partial [Chromobacterium piscinae]